MNTLHGGIFVKIQFTSGDLSKSNVGSRVLPGWWCVFHRNRGTLYCGTLPYRAAIVACSALARVRHTLPGQTRVIFFNVVRGGPFYGGKRITGECLSIRMRFGARVLYVGYQNATFRCAMASLVIDSSSHTKGHTSSATVARPPRPILLLSK